MKKLSFIIIQSVLSLSMFAVNYNAKKASRAPVIDGSTNDLCWVNAEWAPIDQLWIGTAPNTPSNYSGRYKVSWDDSLIYIVMEITDDIFHDTHSNPLMNYWDDDCIEIFIDENKSGGDHRNNYNAFAYHVSPFGDVVDLNATGPALFNNNLRFDIDTIGNVYIWEVAMRIYDSNFDPLNPNASRQTLSPKVMGFSLAYNDSDNRNSRERMYGSQVILGNDKDVSYKNADFFGTLTLVEDISPCTIYSINTNAITKIEAEKYCNQFGTTNQATTDIGGGQNVGFLDNSDWLTYSLNVTSTDEYIFDFRLAALNSGGRISIQIDDLEIGTLDVLGTGGWQIWRNQSITSTLQKGNHILKIQVLNAGWNINYLNILHTSLRKTITTPSYTYTPNPCYVNVGEQVVIQGSTFHPVVQVSKSNWDQNAAIQLPGGFSGTYDIHLIFDTPGEYYFVCSSHLGMKGKIVVNGPTGLFSEYFPTPNKEIQLIPNPASFDLTIKLEEPTLIKEISFLDTQGREVLNQKIDNTVSSLKLNISGLESGLYEVITITKDKKIFNKLIIN